MRKLRGRGDEGKAKSDRQSVYRLLSVLGMVNHTVLTWKDLSYKVQGSETLEYIVGSWVQAVLRHVMH